jgi:hypothetical protein
MPGSVSTCFSVGIALLTGACGPGWHQPRELLPGPLPPRQQVQVWRNGQASRWHAVLVNTDTISGISYLLPITCDTCRVALPRAAVDSLRFGNPGAGFWKTVALVVAIPTAFLIIYCYRGCYAD